MEIEAGKYWAVAVAGEIKLFRDRDEAEAFATAQDYAPLFRIKVSIKERIPFGASMAD